MKSEFNFNEIVERIKKLSNSKHYIDIADMLGLSGSAFANFKTRNSVPFERILSLADSLKVNYEWILTGRGEIYKQDGEKIGVEETLTPYDTTVNNSEDMLEGLTNQQKTAVLCDIEDKKKLNELLAWLNSQKDNNTKI